MDRRSFLGMLSCFAAPIAPQSNLSKYKNEWYCSLRLCSESGITFFVSWRGKFSSKVAFYSARRMPVDVPPPDFFDSGFPDEFYFGGIEFKLKTTREYPR